MRSEIEGIVGARVVGLERVEGGGYTLAGRRRAFLDDGRTVFVKSAVDDLSAGWLRTEIRVYTALRGGFLPVFHGWAEHDGLPLLDVRSDNLALLDGRAVLVDWNWACVGNAVVDVVAWAPPPTGPRVREAKRRQLGLVLPWACRLLGIAEP